MSDHAPDRPDGLRPKWRPSPPLERLDLPPGFAIEVFAEVPGARSLAVADGGRKIYVGTREQDLYAVLDGNRDGVADGVLHVASGLKVPNGLAAMDGRLFVAEQHRIIRFEPDGKIEIVVPAGILPDFRHHGWRYAAFGPDGKLYVAIGAPCNVCEVAGFEGTIIRMNRDGHNLEIFARGVRNSVGFDWHPVTGEMFFTDNGGDDLGDLIPPDELNRAEEPGLHFGYPFVYGDGVPYPQFEGRAPPVETTGPVLAFDAHAAALGMHFYRGAMFPADFRNDAFVAQHGSWNRTDPIGYRIMRVRFDDDGHAGRQGGLRRRLAGARRPSLGPGGRRRRAARRLAAGLRRLRRPGLPDHLRRWLRHEPRVGSPPQPSLRRDGGLPTLCGVA